MSPEESLSRIRRYDRRLNAFVRVFDPPIGHGALTVAVKDLIHVAGVPTGGGGRTPLEPAPAANAVVVDRLLQSGCVIVGKTHTVELACGGWGTNAVLGAPWNPWDASVHRCPGGSSSGSAVAVSAGLVDFALGTDTGGSVRIPAAACGVVGLKPGRGLVSLQGVEPLSPSLDTVGTLARTVAQAAWALEMISGPDGAEAVRGPFDAASALRTETRGWRVAVAPMDELGEVDADVAAIFRQALQRLVWAGIETIEARAPRPLEAYFAANGVIMLGEGGRVRAAHVKAHAADMDPAIVARLRTGAAIGDETLAAALRGRAADQAEFHDWLGRFDALVMPTLPITAPPLSEVDEETYPLSRLTRGVNYLDLPAIAVPCGVAPNGMPVSLQIIGRSGDEAGVVALAAAFERVSGWGGRMPDLVRFVA